MALPRPHTRHYFATSRRCGHLHTTKHRDGHREPSSPAYLDLPSQCPIAHLFLPAAVGVYDVRRSPRVAGEHWKSRANTGSASQYGPRLVRRNSAWSSTLRFRVPSPSPASMLIAIHNGVRPADSQTLAFPLAT